MAVSNDLALVAGAGWSPSMLLVVALSPVLPLVLPLPLARIRD